MADGVPYNFPLLTSKKIVGHLSDLKIHVSAEVLMDPKEHSAEVAVVLEKLVETTTRVTKEDMSQPAFAGLDSLGHPDLHDENISFLAFFRAVHKMMKVSRIDDFSLKDISDPTRPRLRRQLSAVINFCRFQLERKITYEELISKKEGVAASARMAQARNDKLAEELEDMQERMAEKNQMIEEITGKSNAVKEETAALSRTASIVREESATLKKASFAAKDKVATAVATLKQAEVERERLEGQVVNSPQRILREGVDQQQALEQELADAEMEHTNAQKMAHSAVLLSRANREVVKAAAAIDEVATELSKQESAQKEVKSTHRKILEKREEYAARASEISEDQRKLRRFEEKLSHLRKQAAFKSESAASDLDAVRALIAGNEKQWNEAHARLKEAEASMELHKEEKENIDSRIANQMGETQQLMQQINSICRSHGTGLQEAMKEGPGSSSTVLT